MLLHMPAFFLPAATAICLVIISLLNLFLLKGRLLSSEIPPDLAGGGKASNKNSVNKVLITVFSLVLQLIFVAVSFYIILSQKFPSDTQRWAFGTLGLVLGYWLKKS